jgi:integrase
MANAVRWGRLLRNPADAADPPRAGQKSDGVHAWDASTLRQFLDASRAAEDRHHALWVLLATTGMRTGEALGLRWSDVDLDAGRAPIVQTIIQTRNVVSVGEPKTARGRRPISLDPATVAVLRAHRHRMLQERLLVGPTSTISAWCSTSPMAAGYGPTRSARSSSAGFGATASRGCL